MTSRLDSSSGINHVVRRGTKDLLLGMREGEEQTFSSESLCKKFFVENMKGACSVGKMHLFLGSNGSK